MNIRYLLKSIKHFFPIQLKKDEYDIIFYYPSHFNRGNNSENAFFAPFYKLCNRYGIKYAVFEEPELFKKTSRNPETVPFDFPFITILILRKLIPLKSFDSFQHREWFIAKILKPLFRRYRFKNYIVLSNSMLGFFRGLNPNAKLFDYQHGVIFSSHTGYFTENGEAPPHIKENGVNLLLYGSGFRDLLVKKSRDNYYENHTFVLGIGESTKKPQKIKTLKNITFSLQFTGTGEFADKQSDWVQIIREFYEKYEQFFLEHDLKILMKHHPRFDGSINVSPIIGFPFAELFDGSLDEALDRSFLHLTFYSTSIFDASVKGIPTLLWNHKYSLANIFREDFGYPVPVCSDPARLIDKISIYLTGSEALEKDGEKVFEWYKKIYSPLDKELFLSLFTNGKVKK